MRKKIYIVHEVIIDDYETTANNFYPYVFRGNALNQLKSIKEQDLMPIVNDYGYEISIDDETYFEAGREGEYSRRSVCVQIIETEILDYHVTN